MTCVGSSNEMSTPYVTGQGEDGSLLRPGGLGLTERAVALCHLTPGVRVLDLGCGAGLSTKYLRQELGFNVVGLDISYAACRGAREISGQIVQADAARLPFASASVDAVIAECSLSLVEQGKAFSECYRVLKPTGRLILTDMYARSAGGVAQLRELGSTCLSQMFTQDELEAHLLCHGFEIERWEDHSGVLKSLLFRWLMEHGSLHSLFATGDKARHNPKQIQEALREAQPGYFLLIAAKRNGTDSAQGEAP